MQPAGSTGPYLEIAAYLGSHRDHVDPAFVTLSHIQPAVLVTRATALAQFSVAVPGS